MSKSVKGKSFAQKKYYCVVTGIQLYNDFIHATAKINLPDPDDTRDGSEVECPEDLEEMLDKYDGKKKASGE